MDIIDIKNDQEYLDRFHSMIDNSDKESLNMSTFSRGVHNSLYGWSDKWPMAIEHEGVVKSVLFYNITKKDQYITILNVVTPVKYRRNGYAQRLIARAVHEAWEAGKKRIRLNCDIAPDSIMFYNKLGLVYWGVTRDDALYCNLPLLDGKIDSFRHYKELPVEQLVSMGSVANLINRRIDTTRSEGLYRSKKEFIDLERYLYNEYTTFYTGNENVNI